MNAENYFDLSKCKLIQLMLCRRIQQKALVTEKFPFKNVGDYRK